MSRKIIHILCPCWIWLLLLLFSSCSQEEAEEQVLPDSMVNLRIQAVIPGMETKAEDIPEREEITNLRIIVVDKDTREVEYNALSPFSRPKSSYDIPVTKDGTKWVYLLGNAESISSLNLKDIRTGRTWNEELLDNFVFEDLGSPIPFTSKRYEVYVKDTDVNLECHIAIAAIKFTFNFKNNTQQDLVINSYSISSIATKSYLLPHLSNDEAWNDWIDFMTNLPEDGVNMDEYITDYEVPDVLGGEEDFHQPAVNERDFELKVKAKAKETTTYGPIYLHESYYTDPFKSKADEQVYTITFGMGPEGGPSMDYTAEIKGLKSLIRSTHVILNVNVNKLDDGSSTSAIWAEIKIWGKECVEGSWEEVEDDQATSKD
ncbi:hypothetical protein [Parabacteroides timonensis]|uniref:hypothetical protein n=1 Tax=Parabacteroides timonensis TaxID=1871013 RepID=UPI00094EE752|nr:hypothetical protein [Parabacteroides timonensis]